MSRVWLLPLILIFFWCCKKSDIYGVYLENKYKESYLVLRENKTFSWKSEFSAHRVIDSTSGQWKVFNDTLVLSSHINKSTPEISFESKKLDSHEDSLKVDFFYVDSTKASGRFFSHRYSKVGVYDSFNGSASIKRDSSFVSYSVSGHGFSFNEGLDTIINDSLNYYRCYIIPKRYPFFNNRKYLVKDKMLNPIDSSNFRYKYADSLRIK